MHQRACHQLLLLLLVAGSAAAALAAADGSSLGDELRGELQRVTSGSLAAPDVAAQRASEAVLTDHGVYVTRGLSFECSGLQCGATLYLPKTAAGTGATTTTPAANKRISSSSSSATSQAGSQLPPVIVMAHGLGGQRSFLDKFASAFASAGFAVFSFDYRHWGSSDGAPRQWISVPKQLDDWQAAIKHAQSLPQVDGSRLSLWGTSFAGGHVIVVASKLPGQIKAVVSQVPHLDGAKSTQANAATRGTRGNALVAMAALADLAEPTYIPLAGRKGSTALMQLSDHDIEQYEQSHQHTGPLWQNLARARFGAEQSLLQYSPLHSVGGVACPLLIIAGKRDTLCPYSAAQAAAAKAPRATLLTLDAGHFDPYNAPVLQDNLAKQLSFLKQNAV